MIFAAQLWKDNSGRLENKNGDWMYMEETWTLPNETKTNYFSEGQTLGEGQVIRNTHGRVLKANLWNKGMHLKLLKNKTILHSGNLLINKSGSIECISYFALKTYLSQLSQITKRMNLRVK